MCKWTTALCNCECVNLQAYHLAFTTLLQDRLLFGQFLYNHPLKERSVSPSQHSHQLPALYIQHIDPLIFSFSKYNLGQL